MHKAIKITLVIIILISIVKLYENHRSYVINELIKERYITLLSDAKVEAYNIGTREVVLIPNPMLPIINGIKYLAKL